MTCPCSRRALLAACGAAMTACTLGGCGEVPSKAGAGTPSDLRFAFWFETSRCIACASCVAACREKSGTPEGARARRHVLLYRFADGRERFLSYSCMHCEEPACVRVCPAGAISKGESGAVLADKDRCIGCKYCHQACPFHVPEYLPEGMDKCDLCLGAGVPLGDAPACVAACPTRALHYGTLPELIRQSGTNPMNAPGGPSFIVT